MVVALTQVMNATDISIIYLSIGAALGAHYYLENSRRQSSRTLRILYAVLLWPVYSVGLMRTGPAKLPANLVFEKQSLSDSKIDKEVFEKQKAVEDMLAEGTNTVDFYSLKEVLSRYTGLSLAARHTSRSEFYEIADLNGRTSTEIQHVCLSRRNRLKLERHRTEARNDFVEIAEPIIKSLPNPEKIREPLNEFFLLLKDEVAANAIEFFMEAFQQTPAAGNVKALESSKWIHQNRKSTNA